MRRALKILGLCVAGLLVALVLRVVGLALLPARTEPRPRLTRVWFLFCFSGI